MADGWQRVAVAMADLTWGVPGAAWHGHQTFGKGLFYFGCPPEDNLQNYVLGFNI